jgi:predicted lipoprotein
MKAVKYLIVILIVSFVGYNSVYFRKLDEVTAKRTAKDFNAATYAAAFWNNRLIPGLDKAVGLVSLETMLTNDPSKTFGIYSHALGIGNLRYFLVQGKGIIEAVNEDDVVVKLLPDSSHETVSIATEFIFGNAVRDATGLININEFSNTMDFNNVSAEINKIIREKVLPSFKREAKKGMNVDFTGAIELNKEHLDLMNVEVVPVRVVVSGE